MTDDQAQRPPDDTGPNAQGVTAPGNQDASRGPYDQQSWEQLEALVKSGDVEAFLTLLDRHLLSEITPDTFSHILDSAGMFLGPEGFWPLVGLAHEDPLDRSAAIDEGIPPAAQQLVRQVIGRYGEELAFAWDIWRSGGRPDDWKTVVNDVYRDVETGQYYISLDILKYNRERFRIQGEADSILRLTRLLLRVAASVGDPDAFESRTVDRFRSAVEEFEELLSQSTASTPDT